MSRTARLEERLGHRFRSGELLTQALTHRSFGTPHNERLEFLGDGVLGCVIAEALLVRFPQLSEGELSRMRASLVRQEALAAAAAGLGLAEHLRMGQGESASGGAHRASVLADALEALYGAVFLDGGYASARATVLATLGSALESADEHTTAKDPKTRLQEALQARRHGLPRYRVVATRGAAHEQTFEVECLVEGLDLQARGSGASRRAAEQQAAEALLRQLDA
ncbi:MAG: ribonuclease III [Betaproteobacteria bacterium]|nr:ribonuclease III [Betaproteobacteria bacterium]MDH4326355.1 ribonuclease III [Betaproteobacteria bacterium]MDH5210688.1 ribonuclease III [Betaproteobacteria bacterium]